MELKGKVVIITGAAQGIGRAIAIELARNGSIVVIADIKKDAISRGAEEINNMGGDALAVPMDVAKWEDVDAMVKAVIGRFNKIDILVNNAGISPKGEGGLKLGVSSLSLGDWNKVMSVNLNGVFNCSKAVIPFMTREKSGRIVNIASIAGLTGGAGSPASAHYCVSKAAVICLTKVLARELAEYNINVNAIAPGRIDTEMAKLSSSEANEELLRQTPLRKFGQPIDIAHAVLFLVGKSGNFITGETMVIDGGRTMH